MKKRELLGLEIRLASYQEFIDGLFGLVRTKRGHYACFANVHMLVEAYFDPYFASVVNNSSIVTPDGKALCWALRLLYGIEQDRVAGMDVLPEMLQKASEKKLSVFFYGSSDKALKQTREFIAKNYPEVILAGFLSPPYRALTAAEDENHLQQIRDSGADLVFVSLGCPKQEKWMAARAAKIDAVMMGIGGALAVMIGAKKRAPKWMQDSGMEWLFRFIQEPTRLFRRYASTNAIFIYLVCKEFIRLRVFSKFSSAPLA